MQSSDWQSVVARRAKKDPANAGGWHGMLTAWVAADILNPVMYGLVNASCEKAAFGWPCDQEIENLRDQFARASDPARQKEIADAIQLREREVVTHIQLGQYNVPTGSRKTVSGILSSPVPVFWNIEKGR
jgi:peptide/nickel transport system substrate-binding protein